MSRDFWINCGRRMLLMFLDYWDRFFEVPTNRPRN